MSRSDDASLRPAWGSWLVAAIVMAIPLGWVGSQALEEPLYVAGSHLVIRVAAPAGADDAVLPDGRMARQRSQGHSLAMTPAR